MKRQIAVFIGKGGWPAVPGVADHGAALRTAEPPVTLMLALLVMVMVLAFSTESRGSPAPADSMATGGGLFAY